MPRCFFLFLMLLAAQAGRAQTATATLDSARIAVGSATTLTLEVRSPIAIDVQWPALPDSLGGLEILSRGKLDTASVGGEWVFRQQAKITGFDSGMFEVPAFAFPSDGGILETAPVPLLVQTLPADTTQPFRPIKDIIEVPASWLDAWPYLLAGLLLVGALLFVLLRRKKSPQVVKTRAAEGAAAAALRALTELEKSGLLERGAMSEAFTRASDILRRYLEARFGIAALEEPTDAMLRSLQSHPTLQPHQGVLREFFTTADLAKFAKATPTLSEAKDALASARAFIQQTDSLRTPVG